MGSKIDIRNIDWLLVVCYLLLVFIGWMNIYSAVYTEENPSIFDTTQRYGMQFIWIVSSMVISIFILFVINARSYSVLSFIIYMFVTLLLFLVIFLGKEVNGSKSWFALGPISFQPAEVSKISTSLFLSYIMSKFSFKLKSLNGVLSTALVLVIPMLLIILEKETGSALVYCGFLFVLYREGMTGAFLLFGIFAILLFVVTLAISPLVSIIIITLLFGVMGGILNRNLIFYSAVTILLCVILALLPQLYNIHFIGENIANLDVEYLALIIIIPSSIFLLIKSLKRRVQNIKFLYLSFLCSVFLVFSVEFFFQNVLQPHQKARIENLLGIQEDLKGAGYNVHQSKIAIGSGGFFGKGFLEGTQTKYNFVPEQSTDFIFCTIGEEWGFMGSVFIIMLYVFLISRILILAERHKEKFVRIYGYCVASCFFMHVFINIGMTIGVVPVIGIPLPFLSYGGSSLWSFTILLFIFLRLEADKGR